jgi:hypothetical protein
MESFGAGGLMIWELMAHIDTTLSIAVSVATLTLFLRAKEG